MAAVLGHADDFATHLGVEGTRHRVVRVGIRRVETQRELLAVGHAVLVVVGEETSGCQVAEVLELPQVGDAVKVGVFILLQLAHIVQTAIFGSIGERARLRDHRHGDIAIHGAEDVTKERHFLRIGQQVGQAAGIEAEIGRLGIFRVHNAEAIDLRGQAAGCVGQIAEDQVAVALSKGKAVSKRQHAVLHASLVGSWLCFANLHGHLHLIGLVVQLLHRDDGGQPFVGSGESCVNHQGILLLTIVRGVITEGQLASLQAQPEVAIFRHIAIRDLGELASELLDKRASVVGIVGQLEANLDGVLGRHQLLFRIGGNIRIRGGTGRHGVCRGLVLVLGHLMAGGHQVECAVDGRIGGIQRVSARHIDFDVVA